MGVYPIYFLIGKLSYSLSSEPPKQILTVPPSWLTSVFLRNLHSVSYSWHLILVEIIGANQSEAKLLSQNFIFPLIVKVTCNGLISLRTILTGFQWKTPKLGF